MWTQLRFFVRFYGSFQVWIVAILCESSSILVLCFNKDKKDLSLFLILLHNDFVENTVAKRVRPQIRHREMKTTCVYKLQNHLVKGKWKLPVASESTQFLFVIAWKIHRKLVWMETENIFVSCSDEWKAFREDWVLFVSFIVPPADKTSAAVMTNDLHNLR